MFPCYCVALTLLQEDFDTQAAANLKITAALHMMVIMMTVPWMTFFYSVLLVHRHG
jgi:hypothetical protein